MHFFESVITVLHVTYNREGIYIIVEN
jgi:hypothetical protein